MTETRFTKGPWAADELFMENDRRVRVGTTDGTDLYYHRSATICECWVDEPEDLAEKTNGEPCIGVLAAEANARLIAAAPDLYAALENMTALMLERCDRQDSMPDREAEVITQARAALASASPSTGEQR